MYSDAVIGARITTIFDDEHGLYGAKRIAASLKEDTAFTPVNHKKVARIMKAMGLQGLYQAAPMYHYQASAWPPCHAGFSRPVNLAPAHRTVSMSAILPTCRAREAQTCT